jgi:hypothetical protein
MGSVDVGFSIPSAGLGLLVPATLTALISCAPPIDLSVAGPGPGNGSIVRSDAINRAPTGEPLTAELARVEVRYYRFSPTVTVIAWSEDEAGYGLRATVRRDGSVVRDHRLYVSTYYEAGVRAYPRAAIGSRVLKMTGISRDRRPCWNFPVCSPPETYAARIPDELLRGHRDSVRVKFYSLNGREMIVTMYRDVIDKYLAAVDSVSMALRRR